MVLIWDTSVASHGLICCSTELAPMKSFWKIRADKLIPVSYCHFSEQYFTYQVFRIAIAKGFCFLYLKVCSFIVQQLFVVESDCLKPVGEAGEIIYQSWIIFIERARRAGRTARSWLMQNPIIWNFFLVRMSFPIVQQIFSGRGFVFLGEHEDFVPPVV